MTEVKSVPAYEQSMCMDFIGDQSNVVTREGNYDIWKNNIISNKEFFTKGNSELPGLAVYIVCAGPSLDKNVEELKNVSERGMVMCVDAALRYTMQRGIKPEFCISIDGSPKIGKMVEGCDTKGMTLICTPSVHPSVVKMWEGPIFWVTTHSYVGDKKIDNLTNLMRTVKATKDIKAGDELYMDDNYEVEFGGITSLVGCGGNVSTTAHYFATHYLKAQSVVFVGLDLSWKYESHHYAGHKHEENARKQSGGMTGTHKDSNGEGVTTNISLLSFKRWHETFAKQLKGSVTNATEGGIFGLDKEGKKLDFIEFLTLREAVAKYSPIKG